MGPSFTQFSLFVQLCTFLGLRLFSFHFCGENRDCSVLGTSLHPGNHSETLLLIKKGCCAGITDFVSFYFDFKHYSLSRSLSWFSGYRDCL